MDATNPSVSRQRAFPVELERVIFEIAARDWPVAIPSLMLVAQRVKQWVEPLLYRVIILSSQKSAFHLHGFPRLTVGFLLRVIQEKPPGFLRDSVRHVFVRHLFRGDTDTAWHPRRVENPALDAILAACTGVADLFLGFGVSATREVLGAMSCLRRLTLEIDLLFDGYPVNFMHPLFRNITHLEVLDSASVRESAWPAIASIPNLTHLAFCDPAFCPIFASVLRTSSRMQCLIFLCADKVQMEEMPEDPRFVVSGKVDFDADWQNGSRGGDDYWARADRFLAARRLARIEAAVYRIDKGDS
ncbi:hypothetical protein B0H11DRAFT_2138202 [Mycena galericulata]|nr:hypothetical protein B0H11DRAFT_2138202 [Mycena galericulata]